MINNLEDWTVAYLKYRDSITRKIQEIKKESNIIKVTGKDNSIKEYVCVEDLEGIKIEKNTVCLNTKKNVDIIIKNWDNIKEKDISLFFVNPKKSLHWAINVKTHNFVTEKPALKTGLMALFESVPEA